MHRIIIARLALSLAALLVGCGGRDFSAYADQDTSWTRMLRAHAAATWAAAGVEAPSDYILAVLPSDELQDVCEVPDGKAAGGCSFGDEGAVFVEASTPERMRTVALHELGHLMNGSHGHLACASASEAVMCPGGTGAVSERDVAFVRGEL